ncbi:transposase [Rodentibacter caecimuris]|uniref:transposase n=1 Tax=Rodentibacter caecimuris TaxID=1796644 RepID=UPI0022488D99|nr:transposase [Rodentibacter heylii]MCX2960399.1 hypothetical protein [Rodentibacter heylii]
MKTSNRKTTRVTWNSYQNGCYFVTVCTKNKTHYFGEIHHQTMYLSPLGFTLQKIIQNTPLVRPDSYIDIPIFIIMPNHFHFIITLNSDVDRHQHYFGAQRKNLASIIRGIKCALSGYAKQENFLFEWQRGYYEHIIRNENAFQKIYQYIENNVINWDKDCFY